MTFLVMLYFNHTDMGIVNVDPNITFANNFDEDDPDTVILSRLLAWHNKFKKRKVPKKELIEELMSVITVCQKIRKKN